MKQSNLTVPVLFLVCNKLLVFFVPISFTFALRPTSVVVKSTTKRMKAHDKNVKRIIFYIGNDTDEQN